MWSQDKIKSLTIRSLFLSAALILSWLEAILPIPLPIPGFKLGIANIVVLSSIVIFGKRTAVSILAGKILISALLYGSVTSFAFSLAGGILSFLISIVLIEKVPRLSLLGVSVAASAAHVAGQIAVSVAIFGKGSLSMLGWLLLLSVPSGIFTGIIAHTICNHSYFSKFVKAHGDKS